MILDDLFFSSGKEWAESDSAVQSLIPGLDSGMS
jgi:hypothetical protein